MGLVMVLVLVLVLANEHPSEKLEPPQTNGYGATAKTPGAAHLLLDAAGPTPAISGNGADTIARASKQLC